MGLLAQDEGRMATTDDFDGVLTPHFRADAPGAAVAIRQRGEVIHAKGYGLANVEWGLPIATDTVFRIGSVTKQFTAAAILKLAEAGNLGIDDPIERHLPDYPVGERQITVRHLLNHTSGIKSYTGLPNFFPELSQKQLPLPEMIAVFKDLPPDFQPGAKFLYSNSGYLLLGAIIEGVSGQDYATFLAETFFAPLGMASTRYLDDRPITPKRAAGYQLERAVVNATPLAMSWPHAAGALGSTVTDLLRWDAALHGGEVLSPASYAAMITPGTLNDGSETRYGFGLAINRYRDLGNIAHGGGINGFVCGLAHWPGADLTVALLSNIVTFQVEQAMHGLARRALGLPDLTYTPVALDEARLDACAGRYRFDIGPLKLTPLEGGLAGDWPRPKSRFRPMADTVFFLEKDPEVTLAFDDLEAGVYQRLSIQGYGEPVAGRREAEPTKAAD
ncbi:MAG TPA: serine hydrolase domain-containing protein [Caulobacteraceae bacterium]